MAVLGLRFCARAVSSCGKWGPLFIAASLVAEHRLQTCRLSNCGSRAQLLRSMWDLPRPGLEPVSPASAGRFSTTAPPGKPWAHVFNHCGHCPFLNEGSAKALEALSFQVVQYTYPNRKVGPGWRLLQDQCMFRLTLLWAVSVWTWSQKMKCTKGSREF